MVTIRVDEKACVGCALCVDECPTDVFTFDEKKRLPVVEKPEMCFGCLSCSKICPADAIEHEGIKVSTNFYHDAYALNMAAKLGLAEELETGVTSEEADRKRAVDDLGIRLLSIASVLRQTLGNALPAVGRMAGTTLAAQLPRYQMPASFDEAIQVVRDSLNPAWIIGETTRSNESLKLKVEGCFVRDLCKKEGLELGGDLCILFGTYLLGYLGKVTKSRLRLMNTAQGWKECTYDLEVHT
ncbi:ferredoxin family protein [Candidatus Fermentibacteria bacterium]|nr:ferredoxin family protein [Candidatus Fermentibacteria bacterium]